MRIALTCLACALIVSAASAQPEVILDPLYHERCRRPCEFVGFSFQDDLDELREMREHGANAFGSGSMWIPTDDPNAPYGAGVADLARFRGTSHLGQSLTVDEPITGLAFATPTFFTEGSGCTLSLYRSPPDEWGATPPDAVASRAFTDIRDNQRLWLTFPELPAGSYYLEQSKPTGDGIGAWAVGHDAYLEGRAYVSRQPRADDDLELWRRTADAEGAIVAQAEDHHPYRLGLGALGRVAELGFSFEYAVGNWNNGGFPYYPKWFIERFPDMAMLDQTGQPIMAGMFDELAPWPSIDHPVIVDGTRRHIRSVVEALKGNPGLLYWVMGGEALYATYLDPGRWTDHSDNAIAHYRAWLRREYDSVARLNEAWGAGFGSFDEIGPPPEPGRDLPTLDWFRFRNAAMADRFQWHFAETKSADPSRLVVTSNHGNIFRGMAGTWLGQDMALYAAVSDGWEMGQIMADGDSDLYNLMWMKAAGTFGKPLCPVRLAYRKSDPRARGGGTSYTPEAARRYFWESVGTGAWHMGFIQWRGSLPDGEWGVKGSPAQAEIKDILTEWHEIEAHFDDMWPVREPVGLYFSQLTWTLDGFSPMWTRLHKELTGRQIGYRILCDEQVVNGELTDLPVVISADNPVMRSDCVEALEDYADTGGGLILIGANATEDERLQPHPRRRFGRGAVSLRDGSPRLVDRIERLIEDKRARLVKLRATSDTPYTEAVVERVASPHDTPYDLAGHESVGQTFITKQQGLRAVAVSNPTYTKTVTGHELTLEVFDGGPHGEVLGRRTYPAADLTDNAWHDVPIEPPAPAGTYYLRLVTPADLPQQTLGVWGTRSDTYPRGTLHIDDSPADGDLRMKLTYDVEQPARAAIEAFPLSDGLNAMVILTNISGSSIAADVVVSPELLPGDRYHVTDLATDDDLGTVSPTEAHVHVSVPGHRTAVLYFEADVGEESLDEIAQTEAAVEALAEGATSAHRAHLARAREALAAGRYAKALACARRAGRRAPLSVSGEIVGRELRIVAECPDAAGAAIEPLPARFVPLPGRTVLLKPDRRGTLAASVLLSDLGVRYDYQKREYVPYFGALEINVAGHIGDRVAAASCVANMSER